MEYTGWLLAVVLVVWHIKSMNRSHRKRLHQNHFVTYLLLSSDIFEAQRKGFQEWIRGNDAPDAHSLAIRAYSAIENLADRLAAGTPGEPGASSALGATAMIWEFKQRGTASPN